MSKKSYQ